MRRSKKITAVLIAFRKGYRVSEAGEVTAASGKKRSLYDDRKGYLSFKIKDKGVEYNVAVHLLAAYQWFGEDAFAEGVEARHLDGNPLNNSKGNIAIGTHSQNTLDKDKRKRTLDARKAGRVRSKVSEDEVRNLRKDRDRGMSYKELMEKYGVPKTTVSYIVNRRTYASVA